MLLIGLTGGIGCGKSSAAQALASLGALTIDADQLARDVIERGTDGFDEVISRFGDSILKDGEIDRGALAQTIFSDAQAKADLEAIIHPRVQAELARTITRLSPGEVLVYEIPLLVETGAAEKFDFIITIEATLEHRFERLAQRGMTRAEAERRIGSQATREERAQIADVVIDNDGDKFDLLRQIENLWEGTIKPLSLR